MRGVKYPRLSVISEQYKEGANSTRVVLKDFASHDALYPLAPFHVALLDTFEYATEHSSCVNLGLQFDSTALLSRRFTLRPTLDAHYFIGDYLPLTPTKLSFNLFGFSKNGQLFAKVRSEVKVFLKGSNFNEKRKEMKTKPHNLLIEDHHFNFRNLPGVNPSTTFFSSKPSQTHPFTVQALISLQRGITNHPYWNGNGDHVSAMMQMELYQQFSYLVAEHFHLWQNENLDLYIIACAESQYSHYVEFGGILDFVLKDYKIVNGSDLKSFNDSEIGCPCNEWALKELLYLEVECKQFSKICSQAKYYIGNLFGSPTSKL